MQARQISAVRAVNFSCPTNSAVRQFSKKPLTAEIAEKIKSSQRKAHYDSGFPLRTLRLKAFETRAIYRFIFRHSCH